MQRRAKISVCMPVYNAAPFLRESIDSVLAQTFSDFELLIVDDGSTDNSISIIESYKDNRIRLIRSTHDYIGTCNMLFDKAIGDYIARMDADDVMFPERLQIQHDYMEGHRTVDVLCGQMVFLGQEAHPIRTCHEQKAERISLIQMLESCCIAHPTVMIRKTALEKTGLRFEREYIYAEDYRLWVRMLESGLTIERLPDILMKYRRSESQISHTHADIQFQTSLRIREEGEKWIMAEEAKVCNDIPELRQSGNRMSVIIPFLNEGIEVINTVESIRNHGGKDVDIIVVDDCSDDGFCYFEKLQEYNVHYIRNTYRIGAAAAKNKGVNAATTEYVLIIDAHMRFYDNHWLGKYIGALEENDRRILCCRTRFLKKEGNEVIDCGDSSSIGAYLTFAHNEYMPGIHWLGAEKEEEATLTGAEIPCVLGATYATSKKYWNKIKGLDGLIHYGCEEAYLSLKAWMEGGSCYVIKDVCIGHIYRDNPPYKIITTRNIYNYLAISETLFPIQARCFARVVALQKDASLYEEVTKLLEARKDELQDLRNYYTGISTRTFAETMRWTNLAPTADRNSTDEYDRLPEIAAYLSAECDRRDGIGVFDGLMGIVLFFCEYYRHTGDFRHDAMATKLFQKIREQLKRPTIATFADGACGIGWGLIYLHTRGMMEGDVSSLLKRIDHLVMERDTRRMRDDSFEHGTGGILAYVATRFLHNGTLDLGLSDLDETYLQELCHRSRTLIRQHKIDWRTLYFAQLLLTITETGIDEILPVSLHEVTVLPKVLPRNAEYWSTHINSTIGYGLRILTTNTL